MRKLLFFFTVFVLTLVVPTLYAANFKLYLKDGDSSSFANTKWMATA